MVIQHNLPKALMHQKSSKALGLVQQQNPGMVKVTLSRNKELNIQEMLHIEAAKQIMQNVILLLCMQNNNV